MNKKNLIILLVVALLAGITYYFVQQKSNTTLTNSDAEFAVLDTNNIDKIFFVDKRDRSVLLERKETGWKVNDTKMAKTEMVELLLETLTRLKVMSPVSKAARENVLNQMGATGIKVEVYKGKNEPSHVFYIGSSNQDHTGNYMLIEGANNPYLVHIEGFFGFVDPRFNCNASDWYNSGIFNYGYGEIATIKQEVIDQPEESFTIEATGGDLYAIKDQNGTLITGVDTTLMLSTVARFKKIHFESYEQTKDQAFIDSIKATTPMRIYTVTDINGNSSWVKTYKKPLKQAVIPEEGADPIYFDVDRFYGVTNNDEFVVLQYFVFDPITLNLSDFKTE